METGTLIIAPGGRIAGLYSEPVAELLADLKPSVRRASHVEPIGWAKRLAFRALRLAFGERGRVSDWTRSWRGPWQADLKPSGGPVIGPYSDRAAAIAAEIAWIESRLTGEQR